MRSAGRFVTVLNGARGLNTHTAMIVDDTVTNIEVLQSILRDAGYRVVVFREGQRALEAARESPPDIVLLDIMMPGMDGFEVCSILKGNPETREIPVLFITSLSDQESRLKGLEIGAVDFISKPIDRVEVMLRVGHQMKLRNLYLEQKRMNEIMAAELEAAREIQTHLLPENNLRLPNGFRFDYLYQPSTELGGDFLDILPLSSGCYLFYLSDVAGHGVPSALITVFLKEFISRAREWLDHSNPAGVLQRLNRQLLEWKFGHRSLTIFLGILDTTKGTITYAQAGANVPPFVYTRGQWEILRHPSPAVGWFEDAQWDSYIIRLESGDGVFLYSDAALEIRVTGEKQLGLDGLKKMVEQMGRLENVDLNRILEQLKEVTGLGHFADDMSLVRLYREQEAT